MEEFVEDTVECLLAGRLKGMNGCSGKVIDAKDFPKVGEQDNLMVIDWESNHSESLNDVLKKKFGIEDCYDVAKYLRKKDQFLLIIIRGGENFYKTHSQNGIWTLGALSWIGDQKSGRFCVLWLGDRDMYLCAVREHPDYEKYPLMHGAPDLNNTKYSYYKF